VVLDQVAEAGLLIDELLQLQHQERMLTFGSDTGDDRLDQIMPRSLKVVL
jgi:hypothetical protein